jgi:ABC-type transporter Mla maintaining outer membrane lipid asymmetry ATPase subunit MlaF
MLDMGAVIFSGSLDELKASDNERIRMFLERKPEKITYSPDDYLKIIAGD